VAVWRLLTRFYLIAARGWFVNLMEGIGSHSPFCKDLMPKIRVLIAIDYALIREALRALVAQQPDLEVSGETNRAMAAEACRRLAPDVVLIDVIMPGRGGIAGARELRATCPKVKVLVIPVSEQSEKEEALVRQSLRDGVAGYLARASPPAELITAIHVVHQGGQYLSPSLATAIRQPASFAAMPPERGATAGNRLSASLSARAAAPPFTKQRGPARNRREPRRSKRWADSGPPPSAETHFKECPKCRMRWHRHADVLADSHVLFLGHQLDCTNQVPDYFLFHHRPCSTTLSLPLEAFAPLTALPLLAQSCRARGAVAEFCLAAKEGRPCPPKCVCVFVAQTARLIEHWPHD